MPDMIPVARNYWLLPRYADPQVVRELAEATTLPEHFCHLLVQRGIVEKEAARAFLRPQVSQLGNPLQMKGVQELVARLLDARERGDRIGVHGDYDVDGLTSTAVYTLVLRKLGCQVLPFVPHRMIDGYGVADRALEQFREEGVRVVLTCDTGFSAEKEVGRAIDEMGMEVLVTDHHLPTEGKIPRAHALVNPHQDGCSYPFKNLCGAGVAYHVLRATLGEMKSRYGYLVLEEAQGRVLTEAERLWIEERLEALQAAEALPEPKESAKRGREIRAEFQKKGFTPFTERDVLEPHLDLVAIGTVADVMPLVGENRIIVQEGIRQARQTKNLGLRTLCDVMGVPPEKLDEHKFGWVIGPRLNAAGRMSDAIKGLLLLLSEDPEEALRLAQEINAINEERQKLTRAIEKDALARIEKMDLEDAYGIVLCGEHGGEPEWHHGVIGIVASWIKERYTRAVLLMGWDPESGRYKGSGRAPKVGKVHLKDALAACSEHLVAFGGHPVAAGFTLKENTPEAVDAFSRAFNEAIRAQMKPEERIASLEADMELSLGQIDRNLYKAIQWLQPFGPENGNVNMMARGVTIRRAWELKTRSGGRGLKMEIEQDGVVFQAVNWDLLDIYPDLLERATPFQADIFFRVKENDWKKQRDPFAEADLEIELRDIRLPHTIALPAEARLNEERRRGGTSTVAASPAQSVQEAKPARGGRRSRQSGAATS